MRSPFNMTLPVGLRAAGFSAYLSVQAVLLWHAQSTPDFVFGFQMFNASSELKISLFRQLHAHGQHPLRQVQVQGGTWQAKDSHGVRHTFRWSTRVHDGTLGTLDRYVHASYGLEAQLFRLQYALDDCAQHTPADAETEALVAVVATRKNGREGGHRQLISARQ